MPNNGMFGINEQSSLFVYSKIPVDQRIPIRCFILTEVIWFLIVSTLYTVLKEKLLGTRIK